MIRFCLLVYMAYAQSVAADSRYAPSEVLFSLRPGAGKIATTVLVEQWPSRYGPIVIEALFRTDPGAAAKRVGGAKLDRWYRLRAGSAFDPLRMSAELARMPWIEFAQPNYLRRLTTTTTDSLFSAQWNLEAMGWYKQGGTGLERVIVAVVDSGLDYTHPDIVGQLWHNDGEVGGIEGVDDDGNGYIDDVMGWDFSDAPGLPGEGDYLERDADPFDQSGHGTHVAGIIGAITGNEQGIAGIASEVRVMVLRAGFNLPGGGYLEDDDIAAAMVYAAENGAQVINMSWGDPQPSPLLAAAVDYAAERGVVLVAAAGNEGEASTFYPARSDRTIAVGATAPGGGVLAFSNYGSHIDIAAPGHAIWSLAPGGGYVERSGTSMAAAHISGLAALVLARNPQWTAAQVRGALIAGARDLGPAGWDAFSGAGLAHFASLDVEIPPVVQIVSPTSGGVYAGEVTIAMEVAATEQYELSWGVGRDPRRWNVLAAGSVEHEKFSTSWDVDGLIDGPYLLRLRALGARGWVEDRVELHVVSAGPKADGVILASALDGPSWAHLVEWETSVPTGGTVYVEQAGNVLYRLAAPPARRGHRVELPVELELGNYEIWVQASGEGMAGSRVSAGELEVRSGRVDRWAFDRIGNLPDGYLMPQLSDFNGDGLAELVQMGYGGGLKYNAGDFYQYRSGAFERVFTTLQLFIPWGVQDADGDGLLEIMAVDALRVRLLEASSAGAFPNRLIWEQREVWGGEAADLDEDGLPEMFLRSGSGPFFQVFESVGNDQFGEIAVLGNPGEGSNELGQRQVVGDLDGDGRGELISGDGDGDLFAYERIADDAYRSAWQAPGEGDARIIGGGIDLDGDGMGEFVVARFFDDPFDVEARRWSVEVYGAVGDNQYESEWQVEILGGKPGGSGIGMGDFDGDGVVEWVLATIPNLYVFRASGSNAFEPVWHAEMRDTHRPLIGDLDGDGSVELAFNGDGGVDLYALREAASTVERPAGFVAYPLDGSAIELKWEAVRGATGYRIMRDGEVLVDGYVGLTYIDKGLAAGEIYSYAVAAVQAEGGLGPQTVGVAIATAPPPQLLALRQHSSFQLELEFNSPMEDPDPYRFRAVPDLGPVAAAFSDKGGRRIVLSFVAALPDTGAYTMAITGLRSRLGSPLADPQYPFSLSRLRSPARITGAEVLSDRSVAVYFDKPVRLEAEAREAFVFADTSLVVLEAEVEAKRVVLELGSSLRPLGRSYGIRIAGLRDEDGLAVAGVVSFRYAAFDLGTAKPFPNPYRPARGELTFGFLTPEAEISIFDASGQLVRILSERDGDGGVAWDGRNQAGIPLGSGVYFYRIAHGDESRTGKLAVLRD